MSRLAVGFHLVTLFYMLLCSHVGMYSVDELS
jgi:hypothetical protein